MTSRSIKILVTVLIVATGVGLLAFQSIGSAEYYVHVESVYDDPAHWLQQQSISIHGFAHQVPLKPTIVAQTVERDFILESKGKTIKVHHEGTVPDTFKEEAETVVIGKLTQAPDGSYLLTTIGGEQGIMAKCPSKYSGSRK